MTVVVGNVKFQQVENSIYNAISFSSHHTYLGMPQLKVHRTQFYWSHNRLLQYLQYYRTSCLRNIIKYIRKRQPIFPHKATICVEYCNVFIPVCSCMALCQQLSPFMLAVVTFCKRSSCLAIQRYPWNSDKKVTGTKKMRRGGGQGWLDRCALLQETCAISNSNWRWDGGVLF
jgi:hypothetical protein